MATNANALPEGWEDTFNDLAGFWVNGAAEGQVWRYFEDAPHPTGELHGWWIRMPDLAEYPPVYKRSRAIGRIVGIRQD